MSGIKLLFRNFLILYAGMTKDCFWCDVLHFRYKLANNYTSIVFAGILTWERCLSICDTRMKASEENSGEEWFVFPSLDLVVTLSLAEGRESLGKVTVYVLYIWRPETQRCLHSLSAPLVCPSGIEGTYRETYKGAACLSFVNWQTFNV